jgi:hypothetical protein
MEKDDDSEDMDLSDGNVLEQVGEVNDSDDVRLDVINPDGDQASEAQVLSQIDRSNTRRKACRKLFKASCWQEAFISHSSQRYG